MLSRRHLIGFIYTAGVFMKGSAGETKQTNKQTKQTRCSVAGKAPISTNSVTDSLNMVCLYQHHRLKNYLSNYPEKFVNRSPPTLDLQIFLALSQHPQ